MRMSCRRRLTPKDRALVILVRDGASVRQREVRIETIDKDHDLALLKLTGPPLPPLTLRAAESVREGQGIAFTGFPIGGVLASRR